jgi:hypothetical protein
MINMGKDQERSINQFLVQWKRNINLEMPTIQFIYKLKNLNQNNNSK